MNEINDDCLSCIFSFLTDQKILIALVCKNWCNKMNSIQTNFNVIDSVKKLLYLTDTPIWYFKSSDRDLNVELISEIIIHNLKNGNNKLLLYFNNNVINNYQNSEIYYDTNQDYIINFPKILLYLLEIKNYNLLKWICQEHSPNYPNFQYPDDLIEILLDSNYTYNDNLIKKSLWKFLYLFGYDFYEFKYSDHYIIERMRNEANCSCCFGLDPNC